MRAAYTLACEPISSVEPLLSRSTGESERLLMLLETSFPSDSLLPEIAMEERDQFKTVDRFRDVVVAPALEAGFHVLLFATGGHQDDGRIPQTAFEAHTLARFKAVHPGHDDIHQDQIGGFDNSTRNGVQAVLGSHALVSSALLQNHFFDHQ